jgi:hypothetical protein
LIEALGKGGMGEVYRSGDPALGRDLAIKVMKAELRGYPEVERRFLREARITGSLQHPGIVAVHNLGRLVDGRLHYTMRLVRGQTFAAILKDEASKPERLPYLLNIFEKICQAVAYAHSKHIIHRDLKPHNVMVGRFGEVQVMDWGLAKVLTPDDAATEPEERADSAGTRIPTVADTPVDLSRMGSGMGTPSYMPPEQALGEWDAVDERADVFALGSILCEMLTGQPAYSRADGEEVYRRAKRGDVSEALQRLQQCGADAALTTLCRACVSPNREERPRDAAVVAKRVAEHQAEVQERLRQAEIERAEAQLKAREARKQRRLLIALILALLVGGALSTWQAVRATAERDKKEIALGKAEESEKDTKAVLAFFQDKVLSAGRPKDKYGGLGRDVLLRQAVDKAATDIPDSFKDRPLVEASIRDTLGLTYLYLGEPALAIREHERALTLCESKLESDDPDALIARHNLAEAYRAAGRTSEAVRLHEQTLQQREAKLGPDHPQTLTSRNNLAAAYQSAGRTSDAIRLYDKNLKQCEAKLGPDHLQTLFARNNLAIAYQSGGRIAEAIRLQEQTLKQMEAQLGPDHLDTQASRNALATAYLDVGRHSDAIHLLEAALKPQESKLGLDHPETLTSRNNLAAAYQSAGRTADAIRLHEQNLKHREVKLGADHPATLQSRENLAVSYQAAGRTADAIRLHEQNLKHREVNLGPDHPDTLQSRNNLAGGYYATGRTADAIRLVKQNLNHIEAKLGPDHPHTLLTMANLGMTYLVAGLLKEAITLFQETLERGRKRSDGLPAQLAWVPGALAETYISAEQFDKAETIYRELLEQTRRQFGPDDPHTAGPMAGLGATLLRQHKYPDAEKLLRDCLKVRESKQSDDWATFNARSLLGAALLGQKNYAEAEPLLLQGYEGMKARQAKIPPQARFRLTEALERLVRLYEATDQKEKAANWQKKLGETNAAQKKTKS